MKHSWFGLHVVSGQQKPQDQNWFQSLEKVQMYKVKMFVMSKLPLVNEGISMSSWYPAPNDNKQKNVIKCRTCNV